MTRAEFVIEARTHSTLPADDGVPEVAFAGRSNVGKSSFLNALAQRKGLARTSSTPGRTRGLILFELEFADGKKLRVMDLPGYGFAVGDRDERLSWGKMIERYLRDRSSLRAVAIWVDARRGPEEYETQLLEFLRTMDVPWILLATKLDKLSKHERATTLAAMKSKFDCPVVGVSATEGIGRDEATRWLRTVTGCDSDSTGG